jgi:hypothetical protein
MQNGKLIVKYVYSIEFSFQLLFHNTQKTF